MTALHVAMVVLITPGLLALALIAWAVITAEDTEEKP
jgi:hypothetical protein